MTAEPPLPARPGDTPARPAAAPVRTAPATTTPVTTTPVPAAATAVTAATGRAPGPHAGDRVAIRPETAQDHEGVHLLHTRAFGDDGRVSRLVEALRGARAGAGPLSFVAVLDDAVVGHVLLSGCRLDAPRRIVDVLSLSPLGVLPEHQGRGIGTRLVRHALAAAEDTGAPLVFLEGDPGWYGTRGFEPATPAGFRSPSLRIPGPAFQVARLSAHEPWMTGTFVYSEPFWALDCVGLRDPEA
ncbi:GNAT family N-acetyltransferase [Kitasatospora indigofera]|uniref:GNAT family N-acetyltransferase n=1 Tax=Kitasatospora indigofera TaxID=67307 RepID=UPI00364A5633